MTPTGTAPLAPPCPRADDGLSVKRHVVRIVILAVAALTALGTPRAADRTDGSCGQADHVIE
jgi:hypothetical protein